MQAQRILGIALVAVGVVLLVLGIRAADSFSSQLSEFFTGNPTDRAIWMTIGGVVAIVAGATLGALSLRSAPRT